MGMEFDRDDDSFDCADRDDGDFSSSIDSDFERDTD